MRNFILAVIVYGVYAFAVYMNQPIEIENFHVSTDNGLYLVRTYDNGTISVTREAIASKFTREAIASETESTK